MAKKNYTRVKYVNKKTGDVKYYYYEKVGRKTVGKASARDYYGERKHKERKALTLSEIKDYLASKSASFEDTQAILNDFKGDERRGISNITFTKEGLEARLEKVKSSRTENFLRQLGYSAKEFEEEFGYNKQFIEEHGFEDMGDGVYKLRGTDLIFIWDYDNGLMRR